MGIYETQSVYETEKVMAIYNIKYIYYSVFLDDGNRERTS